MQVPTHAWGVSECEIDLRGQLHSQVWIVQVSEERKKERLHHWAWVEGASWVQVSKGSRTEDGRVGWCLGAFFCLRVCILRQSVAAGIRHAPLPPYPLALLPAPPQTLCTLGTLAHARDRGLFQDPDTQGPDLRTVLLTVRWSEVAHTTALLTWHACGAKRCQLLYHSL